MADLRRMMEHLLRATGTFRLAKRTIQRLETTGLQVLKYSKQLARSESRPVRSRQHLVMFHTGRSGSSVIADLLGQHPDIHWDGELFNYRLMLWRERQKLRMREGIGLIKRRMNLFDEPFYGFEVLPTHLQAANMDEGDFIAEVEDLGFEHFILLTRRNILRKIVSNLVARERGQWRLRAGETAPLTRVHVDTRKLQLASVKPLLSHIDDMLADYETLRSLLKSRHCLQIVYEDDVQSDPRCAYRKICEFLGVDYVDIPVRHGQTTPHPLRQIIENYDEVAGALSATAFGWMLEEQSDSDVCPESTGTLI